MATPTRFKELMETVEWQNYGTESGNPQCANCMVHSGYEASGVNYTFGSIKGLLRDGEGDLLRHVSRMTARMKLLNEWKPAQPRLRWCRSLRRRDA